MIYSFWHSVVYLAITDNCSCTIISRVSLTESKLAAILLESMLGGGIPDTSASVFGIVFDNAFSCSIEDYNSIFFTLFLLTSISFFIEFFVLFFARFNSSSIICFNFSICSGCYIMLIIIAVVHAVCLYSSHLAFFAFVFYPLHSSNVQV